MNVDLDLNMPRKLIFTGVYQKCTKLHLWFTVLSRWNLTQLLGIWTKCQELHLSDPALRLPCAHTLNIAYMLTVHVFFLCAFGEFIEETEWWMEPCQCHHLTKIQDIFLCLMLMMIMTPDSVKYNILWFYLPV